MIYAADRVDPTLSWVPNVPEKKVVSAMSTPQTPLTHRGINLSICAVAAFIFLVLTIRSEIEDIYEQRFVIAPPLSSVTAETFSFENYNVKRRDELKDAIQKLFPPGTPKTYIDRILVVNNGASVTERHLTDRRNPANSTIWISYAKPVRALVSTACYGERWVVKAYYRLNETLTSLHVEGPCGVYGSY